MIKIISWNVNSINVRKEQIYDLLKTHAPDFLCIQEMKTLNYEDPYLEELGYNIFYNGEKSYNGVAIIVKKTIKLTICNIAFEEYSLPKPRLLSCYCEDLNLYIASLYLPNGSDDNKFQYKQEFLANFYQYLIYLKKYYNNIIIAGDYNLALNEQDVSRKYMHNNMVDFRPIERFYLQAFHNIGYIDQFRFFNNFKTQEKYTWWDYQNGGIKFNQGMRIDYILVTPNLANNIIESEILLNYRMMERPSDHAPIVFSYQN